MSEPPVPAPGPGQPSVVLVGADATRCAGSGNCVMIVPEVFDQDEDGQVVVVNSRPPAGLHPAVREAEAVCPVSAIRLQAVPDSLTAGRNER